MRYLLSVGSVGQKFAALHGKPGDYYGRLAQKFAEVGV